jgi:uncharacterized protein
MSRDRPPPRQRIERQAVQLTLYIAEPHLGGRRSKVDELLRAAVTAGMSGGTVLAAHQGFGRRHEHEPTMWHRPDETPLTVIFVDQPRRIDAFLPIVDEILPDAVAISEHVRSIRYIRPHRH